MESHRRLLEDYARRLGLEAPRIYLDNGVSSTAARPQLRLLIEGASSGLIRTVLVPGPWVFSLDTATAETIVESLRTAGAEVLEMPTYRPAL
jgi:DNA invertase Pin-like site-specific DNA recombinase